MNTALTLRSLVALTLCATLASCTKDEPIRPDRPDGAAPASAVNDARGLGAELTATGNGLSSTSVDITSDTPAGSTNTGMPNVAQHQGAELMPTQAGGGPDTDTPLEDPVRLQGLENMTAE
ncbi:MAG: hypothetical protein IPJ87_14795 [Flavobacteriales bacterium]|nr:hypothetical protein [Flavobacteriales bacterium]